MPTPQILLTESVCVSLFGSFRTKVYRELRVDGLPSVDWATGLDRSDPLAGAASMQLGSDSVTHKRLKRLNEALSLEPEILSVRNHQFFFLLFHVKFTIPKAVGDEWKLTDGSNIAVKWDISDGMHPHRFALAAAATDDASRVGIRVSEVGGKGGTVWLTRKEKSAVLLANTLHDLFTEQIVGKQYEWKADRRYIFREPRERSEKPGEPAKSFKKKKRTRLAFDDSEYIWGDPERPPETVPDWIKEKRQRITHDPYSSLVVFQEPRARDLVQPF